MKITRPTFTFVLGCAAALGQSTLLAQDWPQWRGPERSAKAAFQAPKTWPKELIQKWKVTVGLGDASPALVGDKLYVFTRKEGSEVIACLNVADGKDIWRDQYDALGATGPAGAHPGPRCSPAVADGKVVTVGVRGTVSCLDAKSGEKLWRKDDLPGWPRFFTAASPIIGGGLCIAQLGGPENGAVVAYELAGGAEKWKWSGGSPAYASPVLIKAGGTQLILVETDAKIAALQAVDGKLVWEAPFAPQGMSYNASTPIVDGDTFFYSGSSRGTKAVKLEKQGDAITAMELWQNPEIATQFNSPVLRNGLLFGISDAENYFCLDAKTGKVAWSAPAASPEAAPSGGAGGGGGGGRGGRGGGGRGGYGSVVDAGSVLLTLTPQSQLVVLEPTDKAFTAMASFKVAQSPTYAYPVASGNRILIKDNDSLTLWTVD